MTLSFTPEVQITKKYCKNTMKKHRGYIGKYIALTKRHIRIFEKKNERERTARGRLNQITQASLAGISTGRFLLE